MTSFEPGYYRVGLDISPGTYRAVITAPESETAKPANPADYVVQDYEDKAEGWVGYRLTPPDQPPAEAPADPLDADAVRFKTSCSLFYSVDNPEAGSVDYLDGYDSVDPDNPPALAQHVGIDNIVSGSTLTVAIGPHVTNFATGIDEGDCGGATWLRTDNESRGTVNQPAIANGVESMVEDLTAADIDEITIVAGWRKQAECVTLRPSSSKIRVLSASRPK